MHRYSVIPVLLIWILVVTGYYLVSKILLKSKHSRIMSFFWFPILNPPPTHPPSFSLPEVIFINIALVLLAVCYEGDVRLTGVSSNVTQGNVEVCYYNMFDAICDMLWTSNDAKVVCRQLGFNSSMLYWDLSPLYIIHCTNVVIINLETSFWIHNIQVKLYMYKWI